MYLARLYKGALSFTLLVGGVTGAWGQVTTASILGTIRDDSGAAIAGAEITIQNVEQGLPGCCGATRRAISRFPAHSGRLRGQGRTPRIQDRSPKRD